MRRITVDERRNRLGVRHFLARPAHDVVDVARALVGLHSSDPATVYLSSWARVAGLEADDLSRALYDERTLLRMLGMRRTMFVVPHDVAAVMDAACTRALAATERRRHVKLIEDRGLAEDGAGWLRDVEQRTLEAMQRYGQATATQLREEVHELKEQIVFGEGKKWGGAVGISTRVLFLMATDGKIVRGRPRGSWISSQYRWAPVASWIGHELPRLDETEARVDLLGRWLATFGPGTFTDLKWWTGWTVGATRKALAALDADEVELEGTDEPGYLLREDEAGAAVQPWAALLPALDPTAMGWKQRYWYFGDHVPHLFDRNGNAGPTVWVDGRVVGGWLQVPSGEVRFELLEDVGREAVQAIAAKAADLETWLGDMRITPRFRTPLEKALSE